MAFTRVSCASWLCDECYLLRQMAEPEIGRVSYWHTGEARLRDNNVRLSESHFRDVVECELLSDRDWVERKRVGVASPMDSCCITGGVDRWQPTSWTRTRS